MRGVLVQGKWDGVLFVLEDVFRMRAVLERERAFIRIDN